MGEPHAGREGGRVTSETDAAGDGPPIGICVLCGETFDAGEGGNLEAASFAHFGVDHRSAEPLYVVRGGDPGGE